MATTQLDPKDRELLEAISRKLNNSAVLNGGFDKLVITVDQIKAKQEETSEKLDVITKALYQPDHGLFSRVQAVEFHTKLLDQQHKTHANNDTEALEKLTTEVDAIDNLKAEAAKATAVAARLKRIAGVDLQELEAVVNIRKSLAKLYWGGLGLILLSIGRVIWEFAKAH